METTNPHAVKFEEKSFDVSINLCCWILLCPLSHFGFLPYNTTLLLGAEDVTKTDVSLCGKAVAKFVYGELQGVDRTTFLCCVCVGSQSFGGICPGCGCQYEKVDEIVSDLKERVSARGDTAQIHRAEFTLQRLDEIEGKLDLIIKHLNISKPETIEMVREVA